MPGKTKHVFWPFDKFWTCPYVRNFLICMALVGAAIVFAQSWNFELKFCMDIFYTKKIASRVQWVLFISKKSSKLPKNISKKFYEWPEKGWKWTWIWIVSSRNGLNYIWMPKNSRILLNCRFFASNTLHSFCNLAVILINFLAKNGLTSP